MGDNFSALIEYDGLNPTIDTMLLRLEAGWEPAELARVVELGLVEDFAFARERYPGGWFALADCEQRLSARPGLPDVSVQRMLPSGFGIVLGADAVWIWHFLRWQFFCRDPRWRAVMLAALGWFGRAFEASDLIVTSDCFETICAFGRGGSFDKAVRSAIEHGQIEVEGPDQLCTIESSSSDVAMEPSSDLLQQMHVWPRDKPLPEGWYRPEVIRYQGWWRPGKGR